MKRWGLWLVAYAPVFEYPTLGAQARLVSLQAELARALPVAAAALQRFLEGLAPHGAAWHEELYFRTFDLSPQVVPYASVHLFGEESFKRAELLAALAEQYARVGYSAGTELPDHLAVLLRAAPVLPAFDELARECLLFVVAKMRRDAEQARNPYAHALNGAFALLAASLGLDLAAAEALAARQAGERATPSGLVTLGRLGAGHKQGKHAPVEGDRG